ncbi:MAG: cation-transporting P-type ATPase [Methanomicrobiales archaeon]|nr:cation-transporting P-type ATPase [Methanomicrobiales archaeon]
MGDQNKGLSKAEAEKRLEEYGTNDIYHRQKISFLGIARHEITEPMILLLLFIGVVYSIWGELFDAITIIVVIVLLVGVEVDNEYRAKKAIAALAEIAAPKARVIRDGSIGEIDALTVVPGDLLILTAGTKVAADARVRNSVGLQLDESAMTGESLPVGRAIGDEIDAGTVVVAGEGDAAVIATGKNTRLGKLAATAQNIRPPKTRLQQEMKSLAGKLVYIAAFFTILITVVGILRGNDLRTMILTGLSLAFATIPEELPIIITMVLGLGAYQLSKRNFLVKQLKAAETLGTTTVIVTDKTGTLTESKMQIAAVHPPEESAVLHTALQSIPPYAVSPLDQAIRDRAKDLNLAPPDSEILRQREFGNGRKSRSILRRIDGVFVLCMSGAPEEIFAICKEVPEAVLQSLSQETERGRRVIAVASRSIPPQELDRDITNLENNLELQGLISFEDPPRKGVKETVTRAREAGIRTIMVTGDHPGTARTIAREVGIFRSEERILTGSDLDRMAESEIQSAVRDVSVFARTTPDHKYRIVKALQSEGEVVAVTGDGINDALALRGADIGIAMGIRGTDVAKDAADVVLADDNYITITSGIFEGRKFADNLRKGIRYYLSIKFALIMIFLLPVFAGIELPFAPIQIIVLELFMDLGASAGFVAEPAEQDIFHRPPRNPMEGVLTRQVVRDIVINGLFLSAAVMIVYFAARSYVADPRQVQTYAFSAWIFGHIALAYVSRTDRSPLHAIGFLSNRVINLWALAAIGFLFVAIYLPVLNRAVNLQQVPVGMVLLIAAGMFGIIGLLGIKKMILRRTDNQGNVITAREKSIGRNGY